MIKIQMKKKIVITIYILSLLFSLNYTYAEESTKGSNENDVNKNVSESYELDEYVSVLDEYVQNSGVDGINIRNISEDLINNKGISYDTLIAKIISVFSNELMIAIKGAITIYIIIVLMAIINSLELEKGSDITKIAHLVCFLTLSTVAIGTFLEVISLFKSIIVTLTTIMQIVSPFLMAILISTGAITSTGIIQPLLLFIASAIGFLINYIVVPFFCISVAFNVICSISENLRLDKLSKMFPSLALWITGIALTFFLGVLSIETSLTATVDSLGVKTTQAAVSNFVPVVGKFFSDSFETVVGATKIIGRVGGTVGIVTMIIVAIIPIMKIASIMGVYSLLSALIEPIYADDTVIKYISRFAGVYKTLLGILIGVIILFVISTGIILNLASSVVT